MKFLGDKLTIINNLRVVADYTSPVLTSTRFVNLELEKDQLYIRAMNNTTWLQIPIVVIGEEDGNILVDGKFLVDILSTFEDGDITFSSKKRLRLSQGKKVRTLSIGDGEDFAPTPKVSPAFTLEMEGETLLNALSTVNFALGNDTSRSVLQNFYFDTSGVVVGCNGIRMAVMSLKSLIGLVGSIVFPNCLTLLKKLLKLSSDDIQMTGASDSWMQINIGNIEVRLATIGDAYPDVMSILHEEMKKESAHVVFSSRDDLIQILSAASFYSKQSCSSLMMLEVSEDKAAFNMETDIGNLNDETDITLTGSPFSVYLPPDQMLEALKAAPEGPVSMNIYDPRHPVIFRCGDDWLLLQAPIVPT